ncbi:MAG: acyclic terpene utilization AtuA family protein, partial [Acidimicrobiales bacterium]
MPEQVRPLRIGAGAGFADDRIEPAVELAERGDLDYLVFECLAERTIALAQIERRRDPAAGFNEWLGARMRAVLEPCTRQGVKIITNMGAANPLAGARLVADVATEMSLAGLKVAAVEGDDVPTLVAGRGLPHRTAGASLDDLGESVVSANAYLGCEPIIAALEAGADVVVAGRVADPAMFLAPLVHEFGWPLDDWRRLACGVGVGHLLECAGHVTGGYFADPGVKDVPDLARLGFPIAQVEADGSFVITKVEGTGGRVDVATCTEQLLYEVHDPSAYVTPDVVADFSGVRLMQMAENVVAAAGFEGCERPDHLKVSVGYSDGFIGEGQISYAGPNAVARGRLALDIVRERLDLLDIAITDARFDLIGIDAVHRGPTPDSHAEPMEVRARVA